MAELDSLVANLMLREIVQRELVVALIATCASASANSEEFMRQLSIFASDTTDQVADPSHPMAAPAAFVQSQIDTLLAAARWRIEKRLER